ncbi:late embryogenesis abundant protein At1g64065-like [Malania oleifera]|uniref:late embryogenesis abundant protein At1g64065-like n=1 Tax=Malania oleifera TaxID=397392 RepID=UPI0025AE20CE|nr:late embryogenesis abundant protein At1g64065-like [Malania oleifera]
MTDKEQAKPLAAAANRSPPVDEEDPAVVPVHPKIRRRRRCIKCCGCLTAVILILVVVVVILAFTVFKVKDPKMKMNSVSIQQLEVTLPSGNNPRPTINLTLVADVSVKNPNAASFKFGNTATTVFYGGTEVGQAWTPPGHARARRTLHLNVTVGVDPQKILGVGSLGSDLIAGELTVSTVTMVGGRVKVIGIIKKHADIRMNCDITISISERDIQKYDCTRHVSL